MSNITKSMQMIKSSRIYVITATILTLLLFILPGCSKDKKNIIPNIRFNVIINLDDPRYSGKNLFELFYVDGYGIAGLKGVIVYRYDRDRYLAFDMVCPNEGDALVKVIRNKDSETYSCPTCKSKYHVNVEYGIVEGVSKYPLKMYNTSYNETTNYLSIYN